MIEKRGEMVGITLLTPHRQVGLLNDQEINSTWLKQKMTKFAYGTLLD